MLAGAVALPVTAADTQNEPGTPALAPAAGQPAPSAAAPPPPPPAAIPDAAAGMEQIAADQVVAVLGISVRGAGNAEVGRIVDVLVDRAGLPRAAVVDVGGFLGVGSRKVALEWKLLRFTLGKTPVAMFDVPSERIKSAPTYDPARPVELIEAKPAAAAQ
jgi:nucleoid-associated protein YgaU